MGVTFHFHNHACINNLLHILTILVSQNRNFLSWCWDIYTLLMCCDAATLFEYTKLKTKKLDFHSVTTNSAGPSGFVFAPCCSPIFSTSMYYNILSCSFLLFISNAAVQTLFWYARKMKLKLQLFFPFLSVCSSVSSLVQSVFPQFVWKQMKPYVNEVNKCQSSLLPTSVHIGKKIIVLKPHTKWCDA